MGKKRMRRQPRWKYEVGDVVATYMISFDGTDGVELAYGIVIDQLSHENCGEPQNNWRAAYSVVWFKAPRHEHMPQLPWTDLMFENELRDPMCT